MGAIELRRVDTARGSCRGSVLEVAWFRTASNKRQKVYWVQTLREIKERYMYIMCIYIYTNIHAVGIICLLWNPWFCSGDSFRLPPAKEDALELKSLEPRCCLKSREPNCRENQFQRLGRAKTTCYANRKHLCFFLNGLQSWVCIKSKTDLKVHSSRWLQIGKDVSPKNHGTGSKLPWLKKEACLISKIGDWDETLWSWSFLVLLPPGSLRKAFVPRFQRWAHGWTCWEMVQKKRTWSRPEGKKKTYTNMTSKFW